MKEKWNKFWAKQTTYDHVLLSCSITMLATVVILLGGITIAVGGFHNLTYLTKYVQMLSIVEHTYIGDADLETVTDAGFSAMVDSLEDRWSYYMTPEEYEQYKDHSANTYSGIGITLQTDENGNLVVLDVLEDSPAEQAGMTPGLVLTALNGESVEGKTTQELGEAIRSMEGEFVLTAKTPEGESKDFTVQRASIYSNPVSYQMLEGNLGYIRMKNFDDKCDEEAEKALDDLIDQGAEGLIFDVRNNGGGYVTELTKLLDRLLPEGEIFVSVNGKGKETVTTSDADCVDLPMVVLVNGNTYSAAEYFAETLHYYGAAATVGEPTTGKGRSQITLVLADGSAVHISSRRYLTPDRVDLSEIGGIVPDITLEKGEDDAQLAAAKEFLLTQR